MDNLILNLFLDIIYPSDRLTQIVTRMLNDTTEKYAIPNCQVDKPLRYVGVLTDARGRT